MSVARNDLTRLECLPDKVLDLVLASVVAEFAAQLLEPNQDFLISKSVKWTSKTVHAGSE